MVLLRNNILILPRLPVNLEQRYIKRDRWHNLMEISMSDGRILVRPYGTKKKADKTKQTNTHTETLG
jgi:hypothetical protein